MQYWFMNYCIPFRNAIRNEKISAITSPIESRMTQPSWKRNSDQNGQRSNVYMALTKSNHGFSPMEIAKISNSYRPWNAYHGQGGTQQAFRHGSGRISHDNIHIITFYPRSTATEFSKNAIGNREIWNR